MAAQVDRWCATCPPGNVKSNWLCDSCKKLPENDGWAGESRLEEGGFELDEFLAGDNRLVARGRTEHGRTKYDTDAARLVLKSIGAGLKLADAAASAGVGLQYAKKISAFWRKQAGIKLKAIAKHPPKPR